MHNRPMEFLPRQTENEIRELTPEEIQTLEHHFTERGVSLPDPTTSTFVGAVRDGRVVAFQCLQLRLHVDPMVISSGHSHLFRALCRATEELILRKCGPQVVYIFVEPGRVRELAEAMGMTEEPWRVMSRVIKPPEPQPLIGLDGLARVEEEATQ